MKTKDLIHLGVPDAHVGYGLPIGGVLATENAVVPYAVGVDIASRMQLTVYDRKANVIPGQRDRLANILVSKERGVELLSSGLDEVLDAYKDIQTVMAAQTDLVETLGRFDPKLVKMCPAGEKAED